MLYELIDADGKTKIDFNPISFKFLSKAHKSPQTANRVKELLPAYTTAPKDLKILLGTHCNYRCAYCRQDKHEFISKEAIQNKLASTLLRLSHLNLSNLQKVEFWGGEPLLYWDIIVPIYEQLAKDAEDHGHQLAIHLTTNGSLLNQEIYDYLKDKPYIYKLSHDGPGQHLRSGDPLQYPDILQWTKDLYQRSIPEDSCQKFYINTVLTASNYNPMPIVRYFKEIFGDDVIIRKMEPAIPYNDDAAHWAIHEDDLYDFEQTLYYSLITGDIIKSILEYQQQWTLFRGRINDPNYCYNSMENKCHAAQQQSLTIDLDGNILPCQVYTANERKLGSIGCTGDFQCDNAAYTLPHSPHKRGCEECEVVAMCRGVCSYLDDGAFAERNCATRFHTYRALLRAFVKFQYNLDVEIIQRKQE